jgi:long-chain acyl-CoA synthetase
MERAMAICTLNELFLHTTSTIRKSNLLMHKVAGKYSPLSTAEVRQAVEDFAAGLTVLGITREDRIALLSENRPGWAISDYAILAAGAVNVPIYPTLPPKQIQYILTDSGTRAVIVSTAQQLEKVEAILGEVSSLEWVITLDPVPRQDPRIKTYTEICGLGSKKNQSSPEWFAGSCAAARADDLASLIYTSGTTGPPKGVMLSHKNLVSNVLSCESLVDLSPRDVALSFLPLCHIYERMLDYLYFFKGVSIAYAESLETVAANLVEVKPTIVASAPRLYEKMYVRMQELADSGSVLKRKIFYWAIGVGREWARKKLSAKRVGPWLALKHRIADPLVFAKVRARMGGRLRFFVSGGAPLARDLGEFFYGAGILILEGYGLTETSPVISFNQLNRVKFGTVGLAVRGVEIKIAEDGEILTRSDSVMMGYYHRPQETAEVITDGWFHTGDIGMMDEGGFLRITDRKKDLIVTSGGKNVAPQNIENMLKTCGCVQNAVVVGNRRNFVSALVVPNFEKIESFARSSGIQFQSRQELVQHPAVVDYVLKEIGLATPELASFERIRKIALLPEDFTVESGEMTPTMKVKRNVVEEKYKAVIDRLYPPRVES